MIPKIDFFISVRVGGGFLARAYTPALEAEADTLAALRVAVKRTVRAKLGADRAVCLRVGETQPVRHLVPVPAAVETSLES